MANSPIREFDAKNMFFSSNVSLKGQFSSVAFTKEHIKEAARH